MTGENILPPVGQADTWPEAHLDIPSTHSKFIGSDRHIQSIFLFSLQKDKISFLNGRFINI